MNLSNYIPLCDAIALLMRPLVEIVMHDLKSGTISYIKGDLSKRKINDLSLIDSMATNSEVDKAPYQKINFDGRLVKSISVPIEDKWLICINCDISIFSQMASLSHKFLELNTKASPESLFKNDWQEKLHATIHTFLRDKTWNFDCLSGPQKKATVKHLADVGAFNEKNSHSYVASILAVGRATIFKYLKEWRACGD
jgi:predicted transcriptional regulator YheO